MPIRGSASGLATTFRVAARVDYVLGRFPAEERKQLPERVDVACEAIRTFCLEGIGPAMCKFNNK